MRVLGLVFLFFAAGFPLVAGEKDSSETDATQKEKPASAEGNPGSDPPKKQEGGRPRVQRPEFLVTPDDRLVNPRLRKIPHPEEIPEEDEVPRQNVYLTDNTGRYHVQVQSFRQGAPGEFQAALGAVSAHVLNQRGNHEYVPYPPNGDPYNYPAYRGHPHATEPPVIRAYERASNPNYGVQPSPDFDRYDPGRLLPNHDRRQAFPATHLDNFGASFYDDGHFYHGLRRTSEPVRENGWSGPAEGFP